MHPIEFLTAGASLMHIVAFLVYNKQTLCGKIRPNIMTWSIWAFVTLLNLASYKAMSGDWIKTILPIISSVMCIATFVISLFVGKFARVSKYDLIALALGIVTPLVWWHFKSATYANMILQASIAIGFVPTFRSVCELPQNEKPLAWFLWSLAYTIGIVVVLMRWNNQYQDIVYYADCIALHFIVALLALRKKGASS